MRKVSVPVLTVILFFLLTPSCFAQESATSTPFTDSRWAVTLADDVGEHRVVNRAGREAVYLLNGRLDLVDAEFTTGIIEFDVLTDGERGFGGVRWHVQPENRGHEEFYIRPHMSGNPDANQYMPVFNGASAWQIYFGPQYSAPVTYPVGEWMHVRIVVADEQAEVYLDSDSPVLFIDDLVGGFGSGGLSLYASTSAFHFANFRYRHLDKPELKGTAIARDPLPPNLIRQFSVSGTFPESEIADATQLSPDQLPNDWSKVGVENNGIANLARVARGSREANTVLARIIIESERDQVRRLNFGYSDRVRVFLGDQAMYAGDNGYRTRDYRYLGTVGLFDQLYLPLKAGKNEVYFAVSESFGGWALMAAFDSMDGIRIDPN